MKPLFLTLEQATKIKEYYKDKVIGYPIDKIDHPHWLISDIQLVTNDGIDWNVVVWSRGNDKTGIEEDSFGLRKYAIMKYLIVYLRETNQLTEEESTMWF
jgi:hypothetical protein